MVEITLQAEVFGRPIRPPEHGATKEPSFVG